MHSYFTRVTCRLGLVFRGVLWTGLVWWVANPAFGQQVEPPDSSDESFVARNLDLRTEITALTAVTTFEVTFENPNGRAVDGNFVFPLHGNQHVVAFASEIDGQLRDAVALEIPPRRVVFDSEDRPVAPLQAASEKSNRFEAKIASIAAHGTARVRFSYQEDFPTNADFSTYHVALNFPRPLRHFALLVKVHEGTDEQPDVRTTLPMTLPPWQEEHVMECERTEFLAQGALDVILPKPERPKVITGRYQDNEYFYAEIPITQFLSNRPAPKTIGLLWDSSSSGAGRDHAKEFVLLDAWFSDLKEVEVRLIRLRDRAVAGETFSVKAGDWRALRKELETTVYDGATSLDGLVDESGIDTWVLFSDGLFNYGLQDTSSRLPLHSVVNTVRASASADGSWLRAMATEKGGEFVDLTRDDAIKAAFVLQTRAPRVLSIDFDPVAFSDLSPAAGTPVSGDTLVVTGILKKPNATLQFLVGADRNNAQTVTVPVISGDDPSLLAPRAWASNEVSRLALDRRKNHDRLSALSRSFCIAMPNTRLVVPASLEDYVRWDVTPPDELRAEWQTRKQAEAAALLKNREQHLEDVVAKFGERIRWWQRDFPKNTPPATNVASVVETPAQLSETPTPAFPETGALLEPFEITPLRELSPANVSAGPKSNFFDVGPESVSQASQRPDDDSPGPALHLVSASPNNQYVEHYRRVPKERRYQTYLEERAHHRQEPAFFLGSADFFFDEGSPEIALQILSNLSALGAEDPELLRVLGHRLMQVNRADLAAALFERALALRPEEPQSFRDLAMAEISLGKYQKAADLLWSIVNQPWDARFPEVEMIALSELNALIATCGQKLDVSKIDSRLLRNLPLDLRVVLTWDSEGTDVDLWLVDPNEQMARYDFPLTYQGGAISRDFTAGYGPEEYDLKKAKPGKYIIKLNSFGDRRQTTFGPVTAMVNVITGFGTPTQKEKKISVRLQDKQAVLEVGTVQMPAGSGTGHQVFNQESGSGK